MSCEFVRRHAGVFVDGELDPATHVEFERHLQACPGCQTHVAFERSCREHVRGAVAEDQAAAPRELRQRIRAALDAVDAESMRAQEPRPSHRGATTGPVRVNTRYVTATAAAAAVLLLVAGLVPPGSEDTAEHAGAAAAPLFEDVVQLHSKALPADVQGEKPDVARYLRRKLRFRVEPAEFERSDVRLRGGRVSKVRDQHAAAFYYDVGGQRMTVVVFRDPRRLLDDGFTRIRVGGSDLYYRQIRGYVVPVRRHDSLNYAFAGDFDGRSILRLAAASRVQR